VRRKGFTLVEIMIVVAIIGMLAAIAIPSFMKSRSEARKSTCVNNLRLIDHAKEQWATTNNKNNGDNCASTDVDDYMKGNTMPACPSSGTYAVNAIGTNPSCTKSAEGHAL